MGTRLVFVGLAAGVSSGLFGIGGGIVMVPMLVYAASFEQHRAHATSLAAGVLIAAAGGTTYAISGEIDPLAGVLLAAGALAGAPVGARLMHRSSGASLKIAFGALLLALSVVLVIR